MPIVGLVVVIDKLSERNTLHSRKVSRSPVVDGNAHDTVWQRAKPLRFHTTNGANGRTANITLRSVSTRDEIYLLVEWTDPTESIQWLPWLKQADGSWTRLKEGPAGDENRYYEDQIAFLWNIGNSIAGFAKDGCQVMCHFLESGKPHGNKYARRSGERADLWHWRAVRTNPVGQMDDGYVDDTRYDPVKSPNAGWHDDPNGEAGYTDNATQDGSEPVFGAKAPPYWITVEKKKGLNNAEFSVGDEVPGVIVAPFRGDRGHIVAKGVYGQGKWTLEIGRRLVSGSDYDVQFDKRRRYYYFGVAVFDNTQVRHSISPFVLRLSLD